MAEGEQGGHQRANPSLCKTQGAMGIVAKLQSAPGKCRKFFQSVCWCQNSSCSLQRNVKPQIRQGAQYQAVIPLLSELKPRPANEPSAKDGGRGGTLVPSAEAVLASVAGPEKAAADALPMDAKMDPNDSIGEHLVAYFASCLPSSTVKDTQCGHAHTTSAWIHHKRSIGTSCGAVGSIFRECQLKSCLVCACREAHPAAAGPEAAEEAPVAG